MGVKELWNILSPTCEKKSLWELQGLNVAIDLSSWIVDSQNVGDNSLINMYLRNLFFRTSYLLLLGVKPVFVLEGKAPVLKHHTIARRQQVSKENKNPVRNNNGSRGRLNCLQKKCEELLLSLGVRCYKSEGEAEALCARLNELGMVDAVISQDSDCFLYGARIVFRNFTMSPTFTCDMYNIENIETKLNLGRQKLLALSLLCGCDYEAGVQGIGKQSALNFLATIPDDQVLNRLRGWRNDSFQECTQNSHMSLEEKIEYKIRKKATIDPNFPSEEVISEFMSTNTAGDLPSFVWIKPSLPNFVIIANRMLAWEVDYIYSKFMPLVTRWHLLHGGADCGLKLDAIIKKRSVRSVPSYELRWQHDGVGEVITTEPIHFVTQVYPDLHIDYIKSKEKTKKGSKGRKKKNGEENNLDGVENLLDNLTISDQKPMKQPMKQRAKQKVQCQQTLEKFLLKEIPTSKLNKDYSKQNNTAISHSTPIRDIGQTKSYHYLSDGSDIDSPVMKLSLRNQKSYSLENISQECEQFQSAQKSISHHSFGDISIDNVSFDLSEIVNSIVNRTNCNPAIQIWANKPDLL